MGTNPMQKMKTESTIVGLTIGLMIGVVLCIGEYFVLNKTGLNTANTQQTMVTAIAIDVKSGEEIDVNKIMGKKINLSDAPTDARMVTQEQLTELKNKGDALIAKIDLGAGTIITSDMLEVKSSQTTDDVRIQEYNMLSLPKDLAKGDYIDVRLQLPNGGDYIVISKKMIMDCNSTTITLKVNEEEMVLMSNAIIEYYIMAGSKLYVTRYTDPGMQKTASATYVPNAAVASLIKANPNIIGHSDRYTEALTELRNKNISAALSVYYRDDDGDGRTEALDNIEENIQKEIKSLKEAREEYFGALNAAN